MNRAVIALLIVTFAFAAHGQDEPHEVDGTIVDGIVALTTQVKAVSLGDLTRALNLDLTLYERSDRATTTFRTVYWRRQTQNVRPEDPLLYFSLTNVEVQLPVLSDVGSPPRPNQSIKLVFAKGRCISTRALEERLHMKFRSYRPPIVSSAHRASESIAALASESPTRNHSSYFLRVPATSDSNKTDSVENGLDLDGECSQQVGISKTFDYDYWKSLCPFKYTDSLFDSELVPALKKKYGNEYTGVALQQPNVEDYGSAIILRFHESSNAPQKTKDIALEIDRCTMKVNRIWEVPLSAIRDDTSR